MSKRRLTLIHAHAFAAFLILSWVPSLYSQTNSDTSQAYTRTEALIPMRDGVRLYTEVYVPRSNHGPLPFLFLRTPYGVTGSPSRLFKSYLKELNEEGYIFVFQDIRGRHKSEGTFVMQRFDRDRRDPKSIDESSDTYDTIDWLLKNVPNNNGRVGMLGISYGGWLTVMGMLDPHPALKAVSEQATPADMYLGDDFHHNGAFRLSYGFEYAFELESSKVDSSFQFDKYDTYEWYLNLGSLSNVNKKLFHGKLPTWNDFVAHPNYDAFWQKQSLPYRLSQVTVPTMHVAGWWDQEDFYGPMKTYEVLEKKDTKNMNYLIVGPWNHGGWSGGPGNRLGKIEFGDSTGKYFRENVQAPWFAYYLKDKGTLSLPEAKTFQTGTNAWKSYNQWPPKENISDRKLYLNSKGRLSFDLPQEGSSEEFDSYVSDPAHPVPYRPRPVEPTYGPGSRWYAWLVEDQRFVHLRPDVLSWETETLKEDLTVSGDIIAHLFASTTGTDCDWIVKLIDVYPEDYPKDPKMGGYQLMIANEVLRARFNKSFEKPAPIIPNQVNEYVIDLHSNNHCFQKGHRIMVQVQSTWFPIIDRNPQKYVHNIFEAEESDFQTAVQKVFHSRRFPTYIELPTAGK
jgi:putative CocE/NonD family hydrolase